MKEQLITFDTAKLAKEKEFDIEYEGCQSFYIDDENGKYNKLESRRVPYEHHTWILAPTQSHLQKWLREVHNIDVSVIPYDIEKTEKVNGEWVYDKKYIWFLGCLDMFSIVDNNMRIKQEIIFDTFEEALEIGLIKALKLIK